MTQHKNFHKNKTVKGFINDKLWTSNDWQDSDDDIIKDIAASEIFPLLNDDKSQTEMTGKKFVEKWRGVIKGADINILRLSKISKK